MNRRKLILGAAGTTAAAFAGCLGSAQEGEGAGGDDARTVSVSESGEAEAEPDLAVVRTSVEVTGDDAQSVRDDLANRSDDLYDALIAYGLEEDDVTTSDFDVRERIDYRRAERDGVDPRSAEAEDEYVHYEGTHEFTVEVHDVDDVGDVIDTAIDAGADDVGRIRFTLSEEKREALREEALEEALEGAHTEAEFVAGEIDATVVEARRVDTTGSGVSPVTERVEMDEAEDAVADEPATELHPDDVTVSATVDVEYVVE